MQFCEIKTRTSERESRLSIIQCGHHQEHLSFLPASLRGESPFNAGCLHLLPLDLTSRLQQFQQVHEIFICTCDIFQIIV